jgi:hypothetical protein
MLCEKAEPSDVEEQRGSNFGGITGKGFKPGQSGNPGGRPKGRSLTAVLRALLDEALVGDTDRRAAVERIAEAVIKLAIAGNLDAVRLIQDRTEGPLKSNHRGESGGENPVVVYLPDNFREAHSRHTGAESSGHC